MRSRTGLGRHTGFAELNDDPLDGLVNLFDVGLVLAVAFLVAGLGIAIDGKGRADPSRTTSSGEQPPSRTLSAPADDAPAASGRGERVGTVYRLPDGRLVLVDPGG